MTFNVQNVDSLRCAAQSSLPAVISVQFDVLFWIMISPCVCTGVATVGIVANNGVLYSESAVKGAHFVELCSQRGM